MASKSTGEAMVMQRVIRICVVGALALVMGGPTAAQSRMVKLQLLPVGELRSLSWMTLAADGQGDGLPRRLPDARELSYAIDLKKSLVWFKVTVNDPLPEHWFGMNVAIDSDGA